MSKKPVTAIIVGAGHRAVIYAKIALSYPDELKIAGVADPLKERREFCRKLFGFPEDMCFETAEELAKKGKLADAVINGTMDHQHLETALPLLKLGYDMLLEKPFARNKQEMELLVEAARTHHCKVMICHVLRYAPFYYAIKERLSSGEIGDIINIQTAEHVSYHHLSASFVRGKWSNGEKVGTTMLLQKCCHDIDLIMWLMGDVKPTRVASFGSKFQFKPENAPEGAGTVCMRDCPLVDTCVYSTKRLCIDHPDRWVHYVWQELETLDNPTEEDRIALMKSDSPMARCIYKCDNTIVDHQSVLINFESGATATHNMIGGTPRALRRIHIVGTKGEINGDFDTSRFVIRKINPSLDAVNGEYDEETVDVNIKGDMDGAMGGHGGGDERLARDFVRFVHGEKPSLACTSIFDSVAGHLTVYLADESRETNEEVEVLY